MINSMADALSVVAEKTYDNTKSIKKGNRQRRDEFVDLYGIEFTKSGDKNIPATFHVSVSGDAAYLERFQFKLVIEPFMSTGGSETSATSLSVDGGIEREDNPQGGVTVTIFNDASIDPNPHKHNITAGISNIPVTASDFTIECEGIDITPYLRAQVVEGGWDWFDGEGVYPSTDLEQSFDLLQVACDMKAEGNDENADKILRQGWKPIKLRGSQPFSATMVVYLKYQHMNR